MRHSSIFCPHPPSSIVAGSRCVEIIPINDVPTMGGFKKREQKEGKKEEKNHNVVCVSYKSPEGRSMSCNQKFQTISAYCPQLPLHQESSVVLQRGLRVQENKSQECRPANRGGSCTINGGGASCDRRKGCNNIIITKLRRGGGVLRSESTAFLIHLVLVGDWKMEKDTGRQTGQMTIRIT